MSVLGDALGKGRQLVDGLLVPKYREKSEEPVSKGELWSGNISNSMLKKAYEKNGITRKIVNKVASDTFDNWFKVESENQQLIEDVHSLFSSKSSWHFDDGKRHLGVKKNLKESYKVGMVEGYSLLALGFSDDGDLKEELVSAKSLDYVSILTPSDVKKLILDEDKNSARFGEIIAAEIRLGHGDTQTIHASRFIHLPVNTYGNNYRGMGLVKPAYNYLTVLDNVIWSTGQSFYRYASGFPHIKKKGGKPLQLNKIKKQWKDVNAMTGWVSDDDTTIDFVGAKAVALDPEKYLDVAVFAVASSFDMPAQILLGTAAGAVTGSETNLRDYYSDISSKQELDWTPIIEQLIVIGQSTGQVAKGDFKVKWNPLQEMNAKEKAEIAKLEAETEKIRIESGVLDPEEIKKELVQEAKVDAPVMNFEYDDRTNLKASEVEQLAVDYSADISKLFSINEVIKAIKGSEVEGILGDDFNDLERELDLIEKARAKKVKDAVDKNVDMAWQYGWDKSELFLNLNIMASEKAGQIKKILKQSNYVFVNSVGKDVTKKTLFAVQQGVLAGEGIPKIRKNVQLIVDGAKHNADTIARTESHRAMTQSIKQSYRDSGKVKKVKYITAGDDMVRQTHADLNGHIFDLDNTPAELEDPNCRCTVVAYFRGK